MKNLNRSKMYLVFRLDKDFEKHMKRSLGKGKYICEHIGCYNSC